jgi:hypothetical protein
VFKPKKSLVVIDLFASLIVFSGCDQSKLDSDPRNFLISEYLFNGNANDLSGNNLHGTVNGAQLTTDRLGIQTVHTFLMGMIIFQLHIQTAIIQML